MGGSCQPQKQQNQATFRLGMSFDIPGQLLRYAEKQQ